MSFSLYGRLPPAPALPVSCSVTSIFHQLHLKPAVNISFHRSLFQVFLVCPLLPWQLVTCVNYADLNNSLPRMRGHISDVFIQGKLHAVLLSSVLRASTQPPVTTDSDTTTVIFTHAERQRHFLP